MRSNAAATWLQTYTGRRFFPLEPNPSDIDIEDIAHALSMQCRFSGHCHRFYSVAEHCFWVSSALPAEYAAWGLLHDAAEAYLVDLARPVKREMASYRIAEANLMRAICSRFGLTPVEPVAVKRADEMLLAAEARVLMAPLVEGWGIDEAEEWSGRLECWEPRVAEGMFLERWGEVTA
jgi:hypothetical protein